MIQAAGFVHKAPNRPTTFKTKKAATISILLGGLLILLGPRGSSALPGTARGRHQQAVGQGAFFKFSFGEQPRRGFTHVTAETVYSPERGYGIMSPPGLETNPESL